MISTAFKTCTSCHTLWASRDEFLADPTVVFVGYQVDFASAAAGYFLFNHEAPCCGTTLAVEARCFQDMSEHSIDEQENQSLSILREDCLYLRTGEAGPQCFECAFVKDVCTELQHRQHVAVGHAAPTRHDQTQEKPL